jgi:hypothetical protein
MQDTSDKDNYRILKYTIIDCIARCNVKKFRKSGRPRICRPPGGPLNALFAVASSVTSFILGWLP